MKKTILVLLCLFSVNLIFAQNGHIKFLGIEVNGQVSTVEQRLTTKGFSKTKDNLYKGKFSGYDVKLRLLKSVKSKTVYTITVLFGEEITKEELSELALSLKEKYENGTPFERTGDVAQTGVELPEGTILLNFEEKSLSYIDKVNAQKNKKESKDDL